MRKVCKNLNKRQLIKLKKRRKYKCKKRAKNNAENDEKKI